MGRGPGAGGGRREAGILPDRTHGRNRPRPRRHDRCRRLLPGGSRARGHGERAANLQTHGSKASYAGNTVLETITFGWYDAASRTDADYDGALAIAAACGRRTMLAAGALAGLASTIRDLLGSHNLVLGGLGVLFSIIVPLGKVVRLVHAIGRWSMADVFVMAVLLARLPLGRDPATRAT
ncbi:MAG: paraquat-inducible protein A [Planctomycetes bacterium]|nr:paraquat-inducible protein A [Planctomycetota bacterium]